MLNTKSRKGKHCFRNFGSYKDIFRNMACLLNQLDKTKQNKTEPKTPEPNRKNKAGNFKVEEAIESIESHYTYLFSWFSVS